MEVWRFSLTMPGFPYRAVKRYDGQRVESGDRDPIFPPLLLLQGSHPAHGIKKKRAKSSIFLPCGDEAAHPAKQLTPLQSGDSRPYPGAGQRTCAKQHPGNAIAFGVIDTAMNQMLDPDERLALQDEIPAGRFAAPEEAAQMILHVLQAPSYMTGQIIGFDGGFL